jgi:hypothetical protein
VAAFTESVQRVWRMCKKEEKNKNVRVDLTPKAQACVCVCR